MTKIETIVYPIVQSNYSVSRRITWQYLRSESARAEAEMITVSRYAQRDVIASIGEIKPKDFVEYKTNKAMNEAKKILGVMIGNCEILARRMVTANILAGKINALNGTDKKGDELLKALKLTNEDNARIERFVNDVIGKIQKGVSLTMASINTMLQNAAIRANMKPIEKVSIKGISDTNGKKKDEEKAKESISIGVEQEPTSVMFSGEPVTKKRAQKTYKEQPLTPKELESLKNNPLVFIRNLSKNNVSVVQSLHNEYLQGLTKNNPMDSKELREKALKEIEGNPAAKAMFEVNKALRSQGLFAFVDKGGKRWTLESYCAMSTRTASSQSTNLGDVFADEEHDLYYIVPHAGSCPLCAKYEGRVYSRSGKNKKYPPLASAFSKIDPNGTDDLDNTYWTIHPNCRHKIIKYVEETKTKAKRNEMIKQSNRPFELTQKQQNEVRENKERERIENERLVAMREFQMYLQVLPPKDVCGNFIKFFEHKKNNDSAYKEVKRKYAEALTKTNKK